MKGARLRMDSGGACVLFKNRWLMTGPRQTTWRCKTSPRRERKMKGLMKYK